MMQVFKLIKRVAIKCFPVRTGFFKAPIFFIRRQFAKLPQAINGLAFAWSVIVGFFKSLFGKKPANVN